MIAHAAMTARPLRLSPASGLIRTHLSFDPRLTCQASSDPQEGGTAPKKVQQRLRCASALLRGQTTQDSVKASQMALHWQCFHSSTVITSCILHKYHKSTSNSISKSHQSCLELHQHQCFDLHYLAWQRQPLRGVQLLRHRATLLSEVSLHALLHRDLDWQSANQ